MIYFLCPVEGGSFIRIERPSISVSRLINHLRKDWPCIAVFKNGVIYDAFLKPRMGTDIRSPKGSKIGRDYYKSLLKMKLPTEYISG